MKIESINNKKVKEWTKLKEKKYRDIENAFLIEGDHLLNEAMKKGVVKEIIALNSSFEIPGIPFYEASQAIMKKISSQVSISPVIAVCQKIEEEKIEGNVCILDNIQDPGNLGTIIRSATAFHFKTIIMSLDTVDIYNEKVIRASEGMLFNENLIKMNLEDALRKLKKDGYTIFGTDVVNGVNLKEIDFPSKVAVIIGNEGKGMKESLKECCDKMIHIPIDSECESLNAGVSASIIFYEVNQ